MTNECATDRCGIRQPHVLEVGHAEVLEYSAFTGLFVMWAKDACEEKSTQLMKMTKDCKKLADAVSACGGVGVESE